MVTGKKKPTLGWRGEANNEEVYGNRTIIAKLENLGSKHLMLAIAARGPIDCGCL